MTAQAREEIEKFAEPMQEAFRDARDGEIDIQGERSKVRSPALSARCTARSTSSSRRNITREGRRAGHVEADGLGPHDQLRRPEVLPDHPVRRRTARCRSTRRLKAAGGPTPEDPRGQEGEGHPLSIDGGTYDGAGFYSSGLFGGKPYAEYTLRFSRAGDVQVRMPDPSADGRYGGSDL